MKIKAPKPCYIHIPQSPASEKFELNCKVLFIHETCLGMKSVPALDTCMYISKVQIKSMKLDNHTYRYRPFIRCFQLSVCRSFIQVRTGSWVFTTSIICILYKVYVHTVQLKSMKLDNHIGMHYTPSKAFIKIKIVIWAFLSSISLLL